MNLSECKWTEQVWKLVEANGCLNWKLLRQTRSHLIFTHCTGFQSLLESNTTFLLFVLVLFPLLVLANLFNLLKIYTPSRQLRSSSNNRILYIPFVNTEVVRWTLFLSGTHSEKHLTIVVIFTIFQVHAVVVFFRVSVIHRTLTWNAGSLV